MPCKTSTTKPDYERRWLVLCLVVVAQFMFVVDAFVVNIAVPSIRADLHASTGEIQGVIAIYQVVFAGLIIVGGRLGDMYGQKPVFLIGVAGFTVASIWCGLANSGIELVAARAAQGAAAALMVPQVLATIHVLFPDEERGKAFGAYGFVLGFGGAVGFLLGGCLVHLDVGGLGWRSVFYVNLPVGLTLLIGSICLMPHSEVQSAGKLDVAGGLVLLAALLCIAGPLSFGPDLGWGTPLLLIVAGGLTLLVSMWPLERRLGRRNGHVPIIQLDLLHDRGFATGLLAVFCFMSANMSFYLVVILYLQLGLKFSALAAGAVMLPLAIAFATVSRAAGRRVEARGINALIEGCAIQIVGLVVLIGATNFVAPVDSLFLSILLAIFGAGQAMVMAPLYGVVLSKVPARHAGSGGGVISTVHQVGNGCGVAAAGSLFYTVQSQQSAQVALAASLGLLIATLFFTIAALAALGRTKQRSVLEARAANLQPHD